MLKTRAPSIIQKQLILETILFCSNYNLLMTVNETSTLLFIRQEMQNHYFIKNGELKPVHWIHFLLSVQAYDLQQDIRFIQKLESKKDAILNRFAKKDFQDEVFYWFRKKDLLLVKVEFYRKTTTYTSDYTWIIKPQMNALLSQAVLQPSIRLKEQKSLDLNDFLRQQIIYNKN